VSSDSSAARASDPGADAKVRKVNIRRNPKIPFIGLSSLGFKSNHSKA
jgi:hypothetical protein